MKISRRILTWGLLVSALSLFSFFKFNFSFGVHHLSLSTSGMLFPVLGAFFGLLDLVAVKWFAMFFLFLLKGVAPATLMMFGIPSFLAALAFKYSLKNKTNIWDVLLRFVLPLACILVFSFYSTGNAFVYSFFWFVPIILFTFKKRNVFFSALSSTFVAHAVGSIIWLFAVPMTSQEWIALIPVVALERLSMAVGMVVIYFLVKKAVFLIKNKFALQTR